MTDPRAFRNRTALLATVLLATVLLLPVAGCGGADGDAGGDDAATPAEATAETTAETSAQRYAVRGEVAAIPDPDDPLSNLVIRHEAIDDFRGIDGDVVGMSSMSMPFPTAEGVSLDGVEVGDKVAFTLEVDWEGDPAYQVVALEPLPADTELEYRKAQPPESAAEQVLETAGADPEEAEAGGGAVEPDDGAPAEAPGGGPG